MLARDHPPIQGRIKIIRTHTRIHTLKTVHNKTNMNSITRNSNAGRRHTNNRIMDTQVQEGGQGLVIKHTNIISMNIIVQVIELMIQMVRVEVNIRNMIGINMMIRNLRKVRLSKRKCMKNLKRE